MTTKAELIKQMQRMTAEAKALQDRIDSMTDYVAFGRSQHPDDKVVTVWRVFPDGGILEDCYTWGEIKDTEGLNAWFWTREEAENWLEKQKLLRDIREFVGHDPDWSDQEAPKYSVAYGHEMSRLNFVSCSHYQLQAAGGVYVGPSSSQAIDVIDKFGDRIKKYLFGVE